MTVLIIVIVVVLLAVFSISAMMRSSQISRMEEDYRWPMYEDKEEN